MNTLIASTKSKHAMSISAITIFIALSARQWTGLDTPDSSFYTSLAIFGDQVTDRAPFDSYYWTRLGYIAPLRGLYAITNPEIGFFIYRFILIAVIVTSIYLILNKITKTSFTTRIFVTTAVASSTVILSYLGNPYLTGFILAATTAAIATALHATTHKQIAVALLAGVIIGWSVQVNPAGAILVGILWVTVSLFTKRKISYYLTAGIAAGITFFAFMGIGNIIFPGLNWFQTFNSTREMNLSDFASSDLVWLQDISLLVPLAVLFITLKEWWRDRSNDAYRLALVLSSVSVAFMLVFSPLMGGIALEAPMYQSMLWPPAVIAMALIFAPRINPTKAMAAAGIALILVAGFLQPSLSFAVGVTIALGAVAVSVIAPVRETSLAALIVFVAILSTFQFLQNSRTDLGLYYLSPYSWAFAPNPIEEKITAAIDVQQWLLDNTTDQDQILTWVDGDWTQGDRELYAVAAMQLWGENRLTLEPTVDDYARAILERTNPTVIALYGPDQVGINTMHDSLPNAGPLTCTDFQWPRASNTRFPADSGMACLTRLSLP
jgi:hypothetical protein